jgi:hypothetical protein
MTRAARQTAAYVFSELVVAGGDGADVLAGAECALNEVAALVRYAIEGMNVLAGRGVGITGSVPRSIKNWRRPLPVYAASAARLRDGGTYASSANAAQAS